MKFDQTKFVPVIFVLFALLSCKYGEMDPRIVGNWDASKTGITVREEPSFMKFKFTKGFASVHLEIDENYLVKGHIGNALLKEGTIELNKELLPPKYSGVLMKIKCNLQGKIFPDDPLEEKEVEFWIHYPMKDNSFISELRYTEKGAQFPMSEFSFQRVEYNSIRYLMRFVPQLIPSCCNKISSYL